MNQQQLQTARAALWHQTAAADPASRLLTLDDVARWLDDLGLCLFLPRHTQLPAPAPSLAEACLGAASVTPPPDAVTQAGELAARLIAENRAIPLNLLGAVSEQPDFLVTPEVLPWVTAVRGERQWKAAPAGRPSPLVMRTWEALEREAEPTVAELQTILGRELTEAAVLRALTELWSMLRAMPLYKPGEPTRWTLLKTRYAAQLTTGANAAQTTALSALLQIYLRSAVAATAEEAEIFLSPLTARSRIREVVHGMMATRQLGTMSVASHTLLFVEGSLPEVAPAEEEKSAPERSATEPRRPWRKEPRPTRWELPALEASAQPEPGAPESPRVPWQKKPAVPDRPRPPRDERGRGERRPAASGPGFRSKMSGTGASRPGAKPWQRRRPDDRPGFSSDKRPGGTREGERRAGPPESKGRPDSPARRPWAAGDRRPPARPPWKKRPAESPAGRDENFRGKRPSGAGFERSDRRPPARPPWKKRPAESPAGRDENFRGKRPSGAGFERSDRRPPARPPWKKRPAENPAGRDENFRGKRPSGTGFERSDRRPPARPPWKKRPAESPAGRDENFRGKRPSAGGFTRGKSSFGGKPRFSAAGKSAPGERRARPSGPPLPRKPFSARPGGQGRAQGPQSRPFRPAKPGNKFGKFTRGERNPRKNRKQEENPE